MNFVPISARTISTSAPTRSNQGARLKKSHHKTTANPHKTPIPKPRRVARGIKAGRTNQASHCSTTAAIPGQSRSDFREVGIAICVVLILVRPYVPHGQFVSLSGLRQAGRMSAQLSGAGRHDVLIQAEEIL